MPPNPLLKAAAAILISECGGFEAASALCRVGPTVLKQYCDVDNSRHIPADVVLVLEKHCGKFIVTRILADAQGCTITGPIIDGPNDEPLATSADNVAHAFANMVSEAVKQLNSPEPLSTAPLVAALDRLTVTLFQMRANEGRKLRGK